MTSIASTASSTHATVQGIGSRYELLATALLFAGAFCCPSTWYVVPGLLSTSDVFFFAAFLFAAPSMLQNLLRPGALPWLMVCAAGLFVASGVITYGLYGSDAEPMTAVKTLFSMTIFPVLLSLCIGNDRRRLEVVLVGWLAGGVLSASVAFASQYGISLFGFFDERSSLGHRARGLTYHPNYLGYACVLLAPVAIYLFLSWKRNWAKGLSLAALGVLLTALYLSGSRASLLALASGLLLPPLMFMSIRRSPVVFTVLLGAAAATLIALTAVSEIGGELSQNFRESAIGRIFGLAQSAAASNHERMIYLQYSWDIFVDNPIFGAGYGEIRVAHMHVMGILQCGGFLGLLAFLSWFLYISTATWRLARATNSLRHEGSDLLRLPVISGVIVWLVAGALMPALTDRNGYILIAVLIALDVHLRRPRLSA